LVNSGLDRLNQKSLETADRLRALTLEQLDSIISTHLPKGVEGDIRSGNLALRAMDSRARLFGLIKSPHEQPAPKPMSQEDLIHEARMMGLLPPDYQRDSFTPTNGHSSNGYAPTTGPTVHEGRF
jgi:hypothetical protein